MINAFEALLDKLLRDSSLYYSQLAAYVLVPQRLYRYLVGPARFELATSTMSRLIELATTRKDTLKFNWSGSDTPVLHYKTHVSSRYHLHHVTRQRNSS